VLFVPGNHEYDMQDFDEARLRLQRVCDRLGLIWLDRETVVMDGVRFIGTTLWSDFDAMAMHEGVSDATRLHKLREKAFAPPISIPKDRRQSPGRAASGRAHARGKPALPGLAA
jgi:hypothetical protein